MFFTKKRKQDNRINDNKDLKGVIGKNKKDKLITMTLGNNVPNVEIFGRSGIGKTAFIESYLFSLMKKFTPKDVRIAYVSHEDIYKRLMSNNPFTLTQPLSEVDDLEDCRMLLKYFVRTIESRIDILKENKLSSLDKYNQKKSDNHNFHKLLPKLILIIDDFSELIEQNSELPTDSSLNAINNLEYIVKMGRLVGVHTILANQSARLYGDIEKINVHVRHRIGFSVNEPLENKLVFPKSEVELQKLGHPGEFYTNLKNVEQLEHGYSQYMNETQIKKANVGLIKRFGTAKYVSI